MARNIGVSPSGKATDSDSVIREFKSLHPSQMNKENSRICLCGCFLYALGEGGSFPPGSLKNFFQLSGSDAFCQTYLHFCRAKRYSVAYSLQISPPPATGDCVRTRQNAIACGYPRENNRGYKKIKSILVFAVNAVYFKKTKIYRYFTCLPLWGRCQRS